MFDHMHYNRTFIAAAQKGFLPNNNATQHGVEVSRSSIPSDWVWRTIGVHKLTGVENNGNHHVYCEVLDSNGLRVHLAKLTLKEHDGKLLNAMIDKPENEPGTNFPLWSDQGVSVWVDHPFNDNRIPSDVVSGIHYGWPDDQTGNTWGHHSYYVVFQAMRGSVAPKPPIVIPPTTPDQPAVTWFDFSGKAAIQDDEVLLRFNWQEMKDAQQANALRFIK